MAINWKEAARNYRFHMMLADKDRRLKATLRRGLTAELFGQGA